MTKLNLIPILKDKLDRNGLARIVQIEFRPSPTAIIETKKIETTEDYVIFGWMKGNQKITLLDTAYTLEAASEKLYAHALALLNKDKKFEYQRNGRSKKMMMNQTDFKNYLFRRKAITNIANLNAIISNYEGSR